MKWQAGVQLKMKKWKILLTIISMIILIGSVSAWEFDNKLEYKENDLVVEFKNAFDLPIIGSSIGKAELTSHESTTEILRLGEGSNKIVMTYDFYDFDAIYKDALGDVEFTDMRTGKTIDKSYHFEEVVYETYQVPIQNVDCKKKIIIDDGNSSREECTVEIVGYEEARRLVSRKPYKLKDIPAKNITIALVTNVNDNDYIDGKWTIVGKKVSRHAVWTSAMNEDIMAIWNYNQSSSPMVEQINGSYNLTCANAYYQQDTGVLPYAMGFRHDASCTYTGGQNAFAGYNGTVILLAETDVDIIGAGASYGLWEAGSDTYALHISSNNLRVYIGGTQVITTQVGSDSGNIKDVMITITWDTIKDEYKYYINDTLEVTTTTAATNSTPSNILAPGGGVNGAWKGNYTDLKVWNRVLTLTEIQEQYNSGAGIEYVGSPTVTISFPVDSASYTYLPNHINYTVTGPNLESCWYSLDGGLTNSTPVVYNVNFTSVSFAQGSNTATVWCNNTINLFNSGSVTFTIDSIKPSIVINKPLALINYTNVSGLETINWSITETNLNEVYYEYNYTNTTSSGAENETTVLIVKDAYNLTVFANDTAGNWNSTSTNWFYKIFENSQTYDPIVTETSLQKFEINVTANASLTAASLVYDSTSYAATQSGEIWNASVVIPIGTGSKSFNWSFTYAGDTIVSRTIGITVTSGLLGLCNSSLTVPFINLSFKNEETNTDMDAFVDSSTWTYSVGGTGVTKSLSFSNTSGQNPNYAFCFIPAADNITIDLTFKYSNTTHPQRTYTLDDYFLSNSTTNVTLYLLGSADGIYTTFQVLSTPGEPISGVDSRANRSIGGTSSEIGSGTTGADGGVTFWVNPDYSHTFVFSKSGYSTYVTTITPTQSSYTVYLNTTGEAVTVSEVSRGVRYVISPGDYTLVNDTSYRFGYNLSSDYWELDGFGFTIKNNDSVVLGEASSVVGTGGNLSVIVNTGSNKTIFMDYYYIANGTSVNFTRTWYVYDTSGGGWGLKTFFTDLRNYADDGMLGLNTFSLTLLIFIFIFIAIGMISYSSGMYSPAAILTLLFVFIALFDYGLGMIPNPVNAVDNFPTIFVALLATGAWIMEWRR